MDRSLIHDPQCVFGILIATLIFFKLVAIVKIHSADDTVITLAKYRLIERLFDQAYTPFHAFCALLISILALIKGGLRIALVIGGLALTSAIVYGACNSVIQILLEWAAKRYL